MNYIVTIPSERYEDLTKAVRDINPYAPNPMPASIPLQENSTTANRDRKGEPRPDSNHITTAEEATINGSDKSLDRALPNAS